MSWSFSIGRVKGTDVRIHVTFLLLLAVWGYASYGLGGWAAAVQGVVFVSLIFFCVLLHEFGHVLAARQYGIRTPDITLLPIGGVARLERLPEKPLEEMVVALAGPAVNVAIAALLWLGLVLAGSPPEPFILGRMPHTPVAALMYINVFLIAFNLIPAFPMDGGRVLRAFLALKMSYTRATNIAARTGQVFAFLFALYGVYHNQYMLLLVAIFVYFGAQTEASATEMRHAVRGVHVDGAMITKFETLPLHATLHIAIASLLRTSQHEFPVVNEEGRVAGMLTRNEIIKALSEGGPDTPVESVMHKDVPLIHYTATVDAAFAAIQACGCPAIGVVDSAGRLIGMFTAENFTELVMIRGALSKMHRPPGQSLPPPLPGRGVSDPLAAR